MTRAPQGQRTVLTDSATYFALSPESGEFTMAMNPGLCLSDQRHDFIVRLFFRWWSQTEGRGLRRGAALQEIAEPGS